MQEKVLMEGVANPLSKRGLATKNGHAVLTTVRFIFSKHSLAKVIAMGILVNATKGSYEYDIPLEQIAKAEVGKHLLGQALTITLKDGTVFKYGILKPLDWKIAWNNALQQGTSNSAILQQGGEEPSTKKKNYCLQCGAKLPLDSNYCPGCGVKI